MLIHLQIVRGHFQTAAAELSSCERDQMATRSNIFTIGPFTEKANQILLCKLTQMCKLVGQPSVIK